MPSSSVQRRLATLNMVTVGSLETFQKTALFICYFSLKFSDFYVTKAAEVTLNPFATCNFLMSSYVQSQFSSYICAFSEEFLMSKQSCMTVQQLSQLLTS
jgi:hypothetical protein